jgi:RNA polymerase sigma-70 factor (ECF subfamily)
MFSTCKSNSFDEKCAESPHHKVANAPTERQALDPGPRRPAQNVSGCGGPHEPLLAAAQTGDRAAFDELLTRQRPRAIAAALRVLHNPDDAEDAVQDAFVKIWRCLPAFEGRASFSTWVHRIVVNASLDLMRRSTARAEFVERSEQPHCEVEGSRAEPAGEQTPESELGDREVGVLVRQAVATLPVAHRQVVELREFEDCSYQEMAAIMRCPVGTVMSRLHHARSRLADSLRAPLLEALAA